MRNGISFTVSSADRQRLRAIVADPKSPQKHVWRARIILLSGDGLGTSAIMAETGMEIRGEDLRNRLLDHGLKTDANGRVEEVKGPGVVGNQPVLEPGESFEYTSFCPLPTPFGTMEGSYEMVTDGGGTFNARIAQFALSQPMAVN